jgi:hypothetical protein
MSYKKLLSHTGVTVDESTVLVVPIQYVIANKTTTIISKHGTEYNVQLYLIPTHRFHRLIKQDTKVYKTHSLSFVGTKNKRKPKTPRYTNSGFTIPFNHLTHFQQNSKGILIGVATT